MSENEMRTIDMQHWIKVIFITCITIQILLVIADYVFNYKDIFDERNIRRIWNIAREMSIPTWFSSIQTQLLGVTALLIAFVEGPSISRLKTCVWILAGLFFLWIGIDDYAELHERLGTVLKHIASENNVKLGGVLGILLKNPSFSWHAFIAPIFAFWGLVIFTFLWTSFRRFNLTPYLVLGLGCWVVSQGIDFTEGLDNIDHFYRRIQEAFSIERRYGVRHTSKVVEEVLEMFGTTLLWIGFLHYLANVADGLQIRLVKKI